MNHQSDDFLFDLRGLIDRWCEARKIWALARLLPGYVALNGLTDGWAELYEALKQTRAMGHDAFTDHDWEVLNRLISASERIVYRDR